MPRIAFQISKPPHVEAIPITDREQWLALRQSDVTASVAGALFGVHDWTTAYSLWAEKAGKLPVESEIAVSIDPDAEEYMVNDLERGLYLEPVVATLLSRARPSWIIEKAEHYFRDPAARIGATPDYYAHDPARGLGIVQVKTVSEHAFRHKWRDPDTRETILPLWIAVQASIEAHLTGAKWACVAALTVDQHLTLHVIDIPLRDTLMSKVREAVSEFWQMIADGKEPPPDYRRDAGVLSQVYRETDGSEIDLSDDKEVLEAVQERTVRSGRKSDDEKRLKEIGALLIHKMGNASSARCGDAVISAPTVNRKEYMVKASSYRSIRVKLVGEK